MIPESDRRAFLKQMAVFGASIHLPSAQKLPSLAEGTLTAIASPTAKISGLYQAVVIAQRKLSESEFVVFLDGLKLFQEIYETDKEDEQKAEALRTELKAQNRTLSSDYESAVEALISEPEGRLLLKECAMLLDEEKKSEDREDYYEYQKTISSKKEELLKRFGCQTDIFLNIYSDEKTTFSQMAEKLIDKSYFREFVPYSDRHWDNTLDQLYRESRMLESHRKARAFMQLELENEKLETEKANQELDFLSWYGPFIDRAAFR